ncbi:MAG: hypothetical protein M1480_01030 [Bacteroidetes bacterium]|nr:hypothetical protein [Bacteroidota bacterium]
MLMSVKMSAQSSFGLTGYWFPGLNSTSLMNSFESNPSNFISLKDWGIALSYGGEFSSNVNSNLYLISISKRLGDHFITVRYTPGYQKEFVFNNGQSIVLQDSTSQSLDSKFTYKELFGLGYSYKISNQFSAGLSFRYFTQDFNQEGVLPVFSDTLYLVRQSQDYKVNFWRGDLGINYSPSEKISFSLSSINLININENSIDPDISQYNIKREKNILFGVSVNPISSLDLNFLYESGNNLQIGLNNFINAFGGNLGIGITAFHDKYQSPYFAGIIPAITYSNNLFGISFSGIKYFSNRNTPQSFSVFQDQGISNIINNRYSFDKAVLTLTFTINTIPERSVEFLDVDILNEIYPTLTENYLDKPFAVGKVVNLTDHFVQIKPSSKIEGINNDKIESPVITIPPGDTVKIPFYTIIPQSYDKQKAGISYADFYLASANLEPQDQTQKPILINGINSWDGKVINLRYFIKRDYDFSMNYAKEILSNYKSELDTMSYALSIFYKTKFVFNNFVKNLVYTANPRAEADYVQFPHETMKLKGGNCDDLSVCFSSLMESVGIQTALVDYKPINGIGHVNVLVNTQLSPEQAKLITQNESKYFIRKNESGIDEVWIPIETTTLTDFNTAWDLGAQKFNEDALNNLGLAKGSVAIVDVY